MKLQSLQAVFAEMVAKLITVAVEKGYEVTLGEAYRPPEVAQLYAKQGRGITNSLHCDRLAIDICLFRDGVYLTRSEHYRDLGEFWKAIGGTWGGDFKRPDGNHFSLAYGGRK